MMLFSKIKNSVNDRKRSKGSTLAELVIVLAVASIISTAVVSYAVMFNKRVKNHNEKLNLMQDMSIAQVFVENWIEDLTKNGAKAQGVNLEQEEDYTLYTLQNFALEANTYEISIDENGVLKANYSSGEKSVAVKSFSAINISYIENDGDYLYYCTLTHGAENYIFTVNPRVGESTSSLQGVDNA